MITTVTEYVTIPAQIARELGIKPGWKLEWERIGDSEEIRVM
ncbi:MAG: AbrB/MazE/SpoVT family DNA-binding domain-containing protein [Chloroflexota bacterium]